MFGKRWVDSTDTASRLFALALAATAAWGWMLALVQHWDGYWIAVAGDALDTVRYALWLSFLVRSDSSGQSPGRQEPTLAGADGRGGRTGGLPG